mgnify:FL=1
MSEKYTLKTLQEVQANLEAELKKVQTKSMFKLPEKGDVFTLSQDWSFKVHHQPSNKAFVEASGVKYSPEGSRVLVSGCWRIAESNSRHTLSKGTALTFLWYSGEGEGFVYFQLPDTTKLRVDLADVNMADATPMHKFAQLMYKLALRFLL